MSHQVIKPYYRQYSSVITRLHSFDSWSKGMMQKPSDMAEAGFFYTGLSDKVICYFCGGGIKDWTYDSVPWEEHARYFQSCSYILIMKGEEYVQKLVNKKNKPSCEIKSSRESRADENEEMKLTSNLICKICLENDLNTCFIPCGHAVSCEKCSLSLNYKCPICRRVYFKSIKIYF